MSDDPNCDLIAKLSPTMFASVFSASGRKSRESYFARHRIRAVRGKHGVPTSQDRNARVEKLHQQLIEVSDPELCDELLRTWLLTRRPMLAAALDHLQIAHQDGLTNSDEVERFKSLDAKQNQELRAALADAASPEEIDIYLSYMGAPSLA